MYSRITSYALFRSLSVRDFAWLLSGQTISRVGDHLYEVAMAWWVLEKTGSAVAMGTVFIFSYAPMLLFLLIGGVTVDRFPRVKLMLTADIVRGLGMVVVTLLAATDTLAIWHIFLASVLFGLTDAFFQPAFTALVPQMVPEADWPSANSLTSMSAQIGRVLGPAIAAGLVAVGGTTLAFGFNALSFLVSAGFLLPLLGLPAAVRMNSEAESESSILADARVGLSTVFQSPVLWLTILMLAITNITLAGPYSVALPFLVTDHLGGDATTLGLLYAIFPIGYVAGGFLLGRRQRLNQRGPTIYLATAVAGACILAMGLPLPLVVIGVAAFINGAALEMSSLSWANVMQSFVPEEKLGRVASIEMLGTFVLLPIGFGIAGWATELMGPANLFLLGGGLTVLVSLVILIHPEVRKLD